MYNILIVDKNLYSLQSLINSLSLNNSNIRICAITFTEEETINYIRSHVPDLIILNIFSVKINLNNLQKHINDKYSNSILILDKDLHSLSKFNTVNQSSDNIVNIIKNMLIGHDDKIKKIINNELLKLHYNFSYIGTKYLLEAIYIIYCNSLDVYDTNLNKHVYPIISNKYHKSINNIKTNIIRANTNMYYDCDEHILNHYLEYKCCSKPSIKDIIYSVISKL